MTTKQLSVPAEESSADPMQFLEDLLHGRPVNPDCTEVIVPQQAVTDALRFIERLHMDAVHMALRLLGEDQESFAPETHEVMVRWRIKCRELLAKASCA